MWQIERRRLLVAGLFSWLAACTESARAKKPSFADVAECRAFVIAAFKKQSGVDNVVADRADMAKFIITIGNESSTGDVTNLFAYLRSYPDEDAGKTVQHFINSILDSRRRVVVDDDIVAVIRHRDYIGDTARRGVNILSEPFGADLVIVYMLDRPDSMSPLTTKDMPGRDIASIRSTAINNVRPWLSKVVSDDSLGNGVLYYIEENTMLSTSLLLMDEFWTSIKARFPGDVLIAIPRKDQLFIFDDGGLEARGQVRRLIDVTIEDGANLLSSGLYARRNGKVLLVAD